MAAKYTNNASTTLASSISSGATAFSVPSGKGDLFPILGAGEWCYLTLVKLVGGVEVLEIVKATARVTDNFTIVRGQQGTSATSFTAGDKVDCRVTAGGLAEMTSNTPSGGISATTVQDAINELDAEKAKLNGDGTQNFQMASLNGGPLYGFNSRIINGDMAVDQRNAGAAITLAANAFGYPCDRWQLVNNRTNGSTLVAQRIAVAATALSGMAYALKITNTTAGALAAGDAVLLNQGIEGFNAADLGWGTASARTITIAFCVIASVAGNYAVSLRNGAANRSYVGHVNVAAANTEQLVYLTVPGDTSGTWLTDTGAFVYLSIDLGVGATYSTSTLNTWLAGSVFGSNTSIKLSSTAGATFQLTGARLVPGTVIPPMEPIPYSLRLMMCQRYLPVIQIDSGRAYTGQAFAASVASVWIPFSVPPRVAPTGMVTSGAIGFSTANGGQVGTATFGSATTSCAVISASGASGLVAGNVTSLVSSTGLQTIQFTGCEL